MLQAIIDTSHQMRYVCMLSGRKADLDSMLRDFFSVMAQNGLAGRYHWNKLSQKSRRRLKNPLASLIAKYPSIKLNVFQSTRPLGISKKEWFIYGYATRLAGRLEIWLLGKKGQVSIIIDDDFNVIKGGTGTGRFAELLLRQICLRLSGKESTIMKGGGAMVAVLKMPSGEVLSLNAAIAEKNSEAVGLADVLLGLYIFSPVSFSGSKNVFSHKI